ncbi:MAG: DNA-formamidopyrimidine glycosylase [Candidatus Saccharimonadales bacterium]
MPELPEVETVKRGLEPLIIGNRILAVDFDWPKSFPNSSGEVAEFVINAEVINIKRRAKVIIIELSSGYSLVIHLKMTGQLVYRGSSQSFGAGHPTNSLVGSLPDKSTRVTLRFQNNSSLFFNDQRKFGWMKLIPSLEVMNLAFFAKLGPEPLEKSFTDRVLINRLSRRPNLTIKAALLDQSVLAGVGNIYADESLWAARIHPATLVKQVPQNKLSSLHIELITVLLLSISKGGSTDKNYVNAKGQKGSYLSFAKVFRREGLPCPRCASTILKIRVAGRGTHYCPKCQKLKRVVIPIS